MAEEIEEKICVVGLGYVGLPLAVLFAKKGKVIGYDIKRERIEQLKKNIDITDEVSSNALKEIAENIEYTADKKKIKEADYVILCMPTPVTKTKVPDLAPLENACKEVGENLKQNAIVITESSVYPGTTEEVCMPLLEKYSGMKCGKDFKIAYSPERVNPGDKEHTIDKIVKIVSGMDKETLEKVANLYGKIITAGIFRAKSIKVAEAAKIIENIQRDLNIALMNELSLIFNKMGIKTKDVLEAAGTKWNFLKFYPGLVGGHCIPVDPYYLTHKAAELGHNPQVILSGREINENLMPKHISETIIHSLNEVGKIPKESKVVLLGLTFKENVKDHRNSRAGDVIGHLKKYDVDVLAYEPLLENELVEKEFGVKNVKLNEMSKVDAVVLINAHNEFKKITLDDLRKIMDKPILIDIKNFYNEEEALKKGFVYKCL